jgi:beta-phosphoglucomutase-like phosphatase (HAD superfamily)
LFGPHVYSAAEVARGKPAPDLFLFAAAREGVDAARCIVIEDSVLGIEAARKAGMAAVGFAGASHASASLEAELAAAGAAAVVCSMDALPSAVQVLVHAEAGAAVTKRHTRT